MVTLSSVHWSFNLSVCDVSKEFVSDLLNLPLMSCMASAYEKHFEDLLISFTLQAYNLNCS